MPGLNAGVTAFGYRIFIDFPNLRSGQTYQGKWGIFRWDGAEVITETLDYAIGRSLKK